MGNRLKLTGSAFGRWTVLSFSYMNKLKQSYWKCRCLCGRKKIVMGSSLITGTSKSCGCLHKELTRKRSTTHGCATIGKVTPEYRIWRSMRYRCKNPNEKNYRGRDITVCKRWGSFENFFQDMGLRPFKDASIDRIDNNGNYSPENCRWATRKQQSQNTRTNVNLTYDGITHCMSEWVRILKITRSSIKYHIKSGKSFPWIVNHFKTKNKIN